ncbi:MAG: LuxR C-terminal-related transcriptional regulator [Planctomycetota bacterium]
MDRDRGQDEPALPADAGQTAMWRAMTTDPTTGVSVVCHDGTIAYVNEQSTRIFQKPGIGPEQVQGKKMHEVFPEEFARERMRIFRGVIERQRPVLFRAIWQGFQHLSWITPIPGFVGEEDNRQVLIISRRVAGDTQEIVLAHEGFRQVNANVIDLGELASLSPRELVVLALLGGGLSLKEIARYLRRSLSTIETQRESIGKKLKLADRAELIRLVERTGLRLEDLRDHHGGPD